MREDYLKKIISSQRNLEMILDNLKDGIIAHDLKRRIFYFNKKAEEITGYLRKEVLGVDCHDALGGPFCGQQCSFCGEKPTLKDKAEYSMNITTKDGESRTIETSAVMMKDEKGLDFGVLSIFRDVTDILNLRIRAREFTGFSNIVGKTGKMLELFQQIRNVATYDTPVHIQGETGTGKELVAHAIHDESHRKGAPFVPINCGALPDGLVESELFGHVKGAFSGAIRDKKGRFELADKGTAFLDEVTELPKSTQVKLLRFLQEGTLEKVGGEGSVKVNVRIISATNKNLKKEVNKGNFRDDLFFRLNVVPLSVPPLRERKNDIFLLNDHFLQQINKRYSQKPHKISDGTLSRMMDYNWPGNVRELENAIQFAIVKCKNNIIMPEDLPMEFLEIQGNPVRRGPSKKLGLDNVRSTLEKTGWNKAKAAKLLGVGRATLYRFLNDHPEVVPEDIYMN
jgi:PAS domain S-box-containing protein